MTREDASFGKYGKAFQEGLVQLIFEDRPFADQIMEVFNVNFLELEYLRIFVQKITNYREKYNKHPSVDAIISILRTELEKEDKIVQKQVRDYFAKIHTRELTDIEYIKEAISWIFAENKILKRQ